MVNAVILKGYEHCIPKETNAAAAVTPGQNLDAGGAPGVDAAGTLRVAYNAGDWGMEKTDDYDAGERVKFVTPPPGVEFEGIVADDTVATGTSMVADAATGNYRAFDGAGGDTADMVVGIVVGDGDVAGRLVMEAV